MYTSAHGRRIPSAQARRTRFESLEKVCKLVNTEDPQDQDGACGERPEANVVRLPRDWLGPRDELVPIGASARPVEPDRRDGLPPTADDFWSEQSASVHGAIQGPGLQREPTAHARPEAHPQPVAHRRPDRNRSFYVGGFAIVAAAVVSITAADLVGAGGGSSTPPRPLHSAGHVPAKVAAAPTTAHGNGSIHVGSSRHTRLRPTGIPRGERVSSHQSRNRTHRKRVTRAHTDATQPVHYSPPASAPTYTGPSTAGTPATSGASSDSSSSAPPPTTNPPNGPIGPGAPFAPGQLG